MSAIVDQADRLDPRFNQAFVEYAQSRGFVIDPARVRTPTDKACATDCTSCWDDHVDVVDKERHQARRRTRTHPAARRRAA